MAPCRYEHLPRNTQPMCDARVVAVNSASSPTCSFTVVDAGPYARRGGLHRRCRRWLRGKVRVLPSDDTHALAANGCCVRHVASHPHLLTRAVLLQGGVAGLYGGQRRWRRRWCRYEPLPLCVEVLCVRAVSLRPFTSPSLVPSCCRNAWLAVVRSRRRKRASRWRRCRCVAVLRNVCVRHRLLTSPTCVPVLLCVQGGVAGAVHQRADGLWRGRCVPSPCHVFAPPPHLLTLLLQERKLGAVQRRQGGLDGGRLDGGGGAGAWWVV